MATALEIFPPPPLCSASVVGAGVRFPPLILKPISRPRTPAAAKFYYCASAAGRQQKRSPRSFA